MCSSGFATQGWKVECASSRNIRVIIQSKRFPLQLNFCLTPLFVYLKSFLFVKTRKIFSLSFLFLFTWKLSNESFLSQLTPRSCKEEIKLSKKCENSLKFVFFCSLLLIHFPVEWSVGNNLIFLQPAKDVSLKRILLIFVFFSLYSSFSLSRRKPYFY